MYRWEGNITLNVQEVGWEMDCVDLAQERDGWLGFVSTMTKFLEIRVISQLGDVQLASEEEVCSTELVGY
jgi:hypothetical protein